MFADTTVGMPGSAARNRIVNGTGQPADVGGSHAGIPLGNLAQPPIPPRVYQQLVAAGVGAQRTAALYEHWLPPARPPPVLSPGRYQEASAPDAGESDPDVMEARTGIEKWGYGKLSRVVCGDGFLYVSVPLTDPVSMPEVAAAGYLDLPIVRSLANSILGDFNRVCDVQLIRTREGDSAHQALAKCAWPYDPTLAPCGFAPSLSRLSARAMLVLHIFVPQTECTLFVRPLNLKEGALEQVVTVGQGEAIVLDGHLPFRWAAGAALRVYVYMRRGGLTVVSLHQARFNAAASHPVSGLVSAYRRHRSALPSLWTRSPTQVASGCGTCYSTGRPRADNPKWATRA